MDVWRRLGICVCAEFVEYNYLDFGSKGANSTYLLSLPNNVPASFVIPIQATGTERFNVVKVGVNYRFNWLGL
jgi:opacity protein-like surface antigen